MRWAGHMAHMGRMTRRKHEWKSQPERYRHRQKDKIKMHTQEIKLKGTNCIISSQYNDKWQPLVKVVMNLQVPYNVGNFLTCLGTTSFLRMTLFYGIKTADHLDSKSVSLSDNPKYTWNGASSGEYQQTVTVCWGKLAEVRSQMTGQNELTRNNGTVS
jgi:hypothetical protein